MDKAHEQDEQHSMEIWRGEVNTNLREMTKTLAEVNSIIGKLPTRAEVEAMLAQKVSNEIFQSEIKDIREELATLKASPGKVRDWVSTGISAAVGCLTLCISAFSLTLSLLIATHIIH